MSDAPLSIGVAGTLGPAAIAQIAAAAEGAGLFALWVNDTPGGDALAALQAAARVTDRLMLGTGVVPLDRLHPGGDPGQGRRPARGPADAGDRLGSGIRSGPGAHAQRHRRPACGDGCADRRRRARPEDAGAGGRGRRRDAAELADPAGRRRADGEGAPGCAGLRMSRSTSARPWSRAGCRGCAPRCKRYARFPKYAANFARLGVDPAETVLTPDSGTLPAYRRAVDEVVLRAMTAGDDVADYLRFVQMAGRMGG
ncbi:LLM class flavin-dependent oxidoreductase [Microbacterium elymi]|uniref:LLM class flavin-dependent oxidoreductase n=1 Tax=Microbacterium elymi TaxID=2909587 RepID=A0ABY5NKE5_9MICO|nr:LLM class flavin-dependent oxidoreductase [Microbacterium elymi]UUT35627.1 LLM class flavin-dependent oxidoreductase [Microbacterium elymi]